jgi:gliding motility-associated-like protein
MKHLYIYCILFYLTICSAFATHIVGGEFELTSSGRGYQYTLTLNLYFDDINGEKGAEDASVIAVIYSKRNNTQMQVEVLPRVSYGQVNYTNPECTSARLQTRLIRYSAPLTLDPAKYTDEMGYYVVWERCCRNNTISNIINPHDAGMAFYMEFPPVVLNNTRFTNSSPSFTVPKGDYACVNEPFVFDFGARDPDGDQLEYKLVTPYNGYSSSQPTTNRNPYSLGKYYKAPYPEVKWATGFNLSNVIPGRAPLRVNSATGQITFTAGRTGLFVFSVLAEEYRNGKKIGEVRRDFQLMVIDCPKNIPPKVQVREPGSSKFYTPGKVIKVAVNGDRCFNVAIADSNLREQINLSLRPLNFAAGLATLSPLQGTLNGPSDTIRAKVCFVECAYNKPGEPYLFQIIASDNGCPVPKRDTLQIAIDFEQKLNSPPQTFTDLPGNTAEIIAGNAIRFNVTGTDADNEKISLTAVGRGFDLAAAGMLFTNGSGIGKVSSPFVWEPDCNKAEADKTYKIDFITKDERCPGEQKIDTVSVTLVYKSRTTNQPDVITSLTSNKVRLLTNQEIKFDVIATDPDNDPIVLRAVGRGFNLEEVGMNFRNNRTGIGKITEPFSWLPVCDNILSDRSTYIIDFIVTDNSCARNRSDTITVELEITDHIMTFDGFEPPNVFTPNGDGKNDTFFIPDLPVDNCRDGFERIEIYNRWGKQVYIGDNREFSWNGAGFPTGVYFYLIHYRSRTYKGSVSLLR